jgi:perosamine synthetase
VIPRRRLPLAWADFGVALAALGLTPARAAAEVAAFEREFARRMAVPHAFAVSSGREALCLIVDSLGLVAGDELVIPAYTLGELLPLLAGRGLVLVPADVDPASFNVSVDSVRAVLGAKTRAILAVHLLGAPCPIAGLAELAAASGVALIEDCAHAPGASVGGRPVGTFGVAALFSLEANKALAAFGGGVLATRDAALAARVQAALAGRPSREWPAVRKFLLKAVEEVVVRSPLYGVLARWLFAEGRAAAFERFYRGANEHVRRAGKAVPAAFSGTQARWARRRLRQLDARHARLAPLWEQLAATLPDGFAAQAREAHGEPVFYNFVARYDGEIPALRQAALRRGLDLGIGGEVMDDCARLLGRDDCPGAARSARQAVLIPCWDGMNEATAQQVMARLRAAAGDLR